MVKDIRPGSNSSNITILKFISGILYFQANDGVNGKELWRSDGTNAGTFMLKDFNAGAGSMSAIRTHLAYNNKLFMSYGANVWESNGSIAGTITNTLIPTTSTWAGIQSNLYIFNNDLYYYSGVIDFSMTSVWDSISLYKITSSVSNTSLVKKMKPATYVGNGYFSIFQTDAGKFITLGDGSPGNYGCFIASDGTNAGTGIASCKSVSYLNNSGLFIPYYNPIPFLNNAWYYPLYNSSVGGYQIYKIDASTYTVSLLTTIGSGGDFYSGTGCGFWGYFHEMLCNNFIFWANDGSSGTELWISDGTPGGTNLALDIYPGSTPSIPNGCDDYARYAVTSNKFYFYAWDGVSGDELWAVNLCGALGLNETSNTNLEFYVYPNPANKLLNIKSNSKSNSEIQVMNYLGQTVLEQKYSESIDVSKLSPGWYFLRVDNYYSKFIKE